jgi:hypothetical protein
MDNLTYVADPELIATIAGTKSEIEWRIQVANA